MHFHHLLCLCCLLAHCHSAAHAGLHTEVGQMVREKWRSMLASCCHGTAYLPDKRLGQLLQQWGGDEDEEGVQEATQVEGRERRLKVLGEDLTALELKEVLQVLLASRLLIYCFCDGFSHLHSNHLELKDLLQLLYFSQLPSS